MVTEFPLAVLKMISSIFPMENITNFQLEVLENISSRLFLIKEGINSQICTFMESMCGSKSFIDTF